MSMEIQLNEIETPYKLTNGMKDAIDEAQV